MTELLVVTNTGGSDALIMVLSFFGSLLFPAALKRTFAKGNPAIYYLAYFLISLVLGALLGAVHAVVSTDMTRAVVGFVPIFSFMYAAAHEVRGDLTLPFIAINGGLLAYSFFALLMKSRDEWKKTRIQEAKAIALHVSST
jgi:hypothetical protein